AASTRRWTRRAGTSARRCTWSSRAGARTPTASPNGTGCRRRRAPTCARWRNWPAARSVLSAPVRTASTPWCCATRTPEPPARDTGWYAAAMQHAGVDSEALPLPREQRLREQHLREELANALTHGVGAAAALAGGAVLITLAAIRGDGWQLAGAIVFGIALLLLYVASTLYHAIQHPVAKGRLKVFDHCAIYLLIAGTYTPFTLIGLRGPTGWWLFGAIWTLALAGVVFKLFF